MIIPLSILSSSEKCINLKKKKKMLSLICSPLPRIYIFTHNVKTFHILVDICRYIDILPFCILHKHVNLFRGEIYRAQVEERSVQPLGGLIYTPLTLYQAREKSLTNHFALSAHHSCPALLCWRESKEEYRK